MPSRCPRSLLVVDSIQTMTSAGVDGVVSGVTQVREATSALIRLAKERRMACILVGHVTKDGGIAGPRTLEHLVDVVLSFEGDRHARLRMVRAVKNRYGPTDEVGCFELGEEGLVALADPSGLFVTDRAEPVPGTCVTVALEGRRPLLAEIQALVVPAAGSVPRRTTSGMDAARIAMVLAVLERRESVPMSRYDTYIAPVGGARLVEPACDLAVALAVNGSVRDMSVPVGWVAFGEVGLAGDVRRVPGARQRVMEAARLGMTDVILPRGDGASLGDLGVRVHPVDDLSGALRLMPWARPDLVRQAVGPVAVPQARCGPVVPASSYAAEAQPRPCAGVRAPPAGVWGQARRGGRLRAASAPSATSPGAAVLAQDVVGGLAHQLDELVARTRGTPAPRPRARPARWCSTSRGRGHPRPTRGGRTRRSRSPGPRCRRGGPRPRRCAGWAAASTRRASSG